MASFLKYVDLYLTSEWGRFYLGHSVEDCLLGCSVMLSGRSVPTFQSCLLPPSSRAIAQDDRGGKHLWNTCPNSPTIQKTVIYIHASVRTWNVTSDGHFSPSSVKVDYDTLYIQFGWQMHTEFWLQPYYTGYCWIPNCMRCIFNMTLR
jgi:hypothetical protein